MRVLRNAYVDSWRGREDEIAPFPLQALATEGRGAWAAHHGDLVEGVLPAGAVSGIVSGVERAGDVVASMAAEAVAALTAAAAGAPRTGSMGGHERA
jgi:enoyl-[acyl-carrier protein] reductase II